MELRVDEVAFEVRREHPRRRRRRIGARFADRGQQPSKHCRTAGDRRRTERRDPETRQPAGDRTHRLLIIERVDALHAMHVDIDKSRHDEMIGDINPLVGSGRARAGGDLDNQLTIDRHRPGAHDPIGKYNISA